MKIASGVSLVLLQWQEAHYLWRSSIPFWGGALVFSKVLFVVSRNWPSLLKAAFSSAPSFHLQVPHSSSGSSFWFYWGLEGRAAAGGQEKLRGGPGWGALPLGIWDFRSRLLTRSWWFLLLTLHPFVLFRDPSPWIQHEMSNLLHRHNPLPEAFPVALSLGVADAQAWEMNFFHMSQVQLGDTRSIKYAITWIPLAQYSCFDQGLVGTCRRGMMLWHSCHPIHSTLAKHWPHGCKRASNLASDLSPIDRFEAIWSLLKLVFILGPSYLCLGVGNIIRSFWAK